MRKMSRQPYHYYLLDFVLLTLRTIEGSLLHLRQKPSPGYGLLLPQYQQNPSLILPSALILSLSHEFAAIIIVVLRPKSAGGGRL